MEYAELKQIRNAIIEELKTEVAPAAFTIEHYRIAELRVQTVLMMQQMNVAAAPKKEDGAADVRPAADTVMSIEESAEETRGNKKRS